MPQSVQFLLGGDMLPLSVTSTAVWTARVFYIDERNVLMTSLSTGLLTSDRTHTVSIREHTDCVVDDLLASLTHAEHLSADERRGIIARYTAVLEGNFIYWMTGAYLSVRSEQARSIILDNLREEVRDCHPGMLRRFAMAAHAVPNDLDALAVYRNLSNVRLFIGRLSPVPIVAMMTFFEGFIQRFMPYLAEVAQRQGSVEEEYTEVHGVCDVAHTQELFRALEAEMTLADESQEPVENLFEGVDLLQTLIRNIVANPKRSKR
jgi:hypothetical protein